MTSKRLHLLLLAVIGLLVIGLLAGTYEISGLLTIRARSLTSLKAQSMALDQEQVSLKNAKRDIAKYSGLNKIAQTVVPQDKNQAEAVRQIVNIAQANSINLASVTFPNSTLGNLPAAASGATAAPAATPAPQPANSKTNALSQLTPVKTIPGVYDLLITVASDPNQPVPYSQFTNFLSSLEHNRRTAQVNTITIEPKTENRSLLSFTLTLNEYIKP